MSEKKLLMIVNPRAGRSKPRGPLYDAAAAFCDAGYTLCIRRTAAAGDARRIAENEGGDGIVKLIIDRKHRRLLGVHMIGSYASEIIYGAAMMVEREMRVRDVQKFVFPHPSVCEVIREAMFSIK